MNQANLEYARNIGQRLFHSAPCVPGPWECPYCGSDLFRLLPGNKIECPMCGIAGDIQPGQEPRFKPDQECRLSEDQILEHFDGWVREMKTKFLEEKDQLKEVQKGYKEFDWWIKP